MKLDYETFVPVVLQYPPIGHVAHTLRPELGLKKLTAHLLASGSSPNPVVVQKKPGAHGRGAVIPVKGQYTGDVGHAPKHVVTYPCNLILFKKMYKKTKT